MPTPYDQLKSILDRDPALLLTNQRLEQTTRLLLAKGTNEQKLSIATWLIAAAGTERPGYALEFFPRTLELGMQHADSQTRLALAATAVALSRISNDLTTANALGNVAVRAASREADPAVGVALVDLLAQIDGFVVNARQELEQRALAAPTVEVRARALALLTARVPTATPEQHERLELLAASQVVAEPAGTARARVLDLYQATGTRAPTIAHAITTPPPELQRQAMGIVEAWGPTRPTDTTDPVHQALTAQLYSGQPALRRAAAAALVASNDDPAKRTELITAAFTAMQRRQQQPSPAPNTSPAPTYGTHEAILAGGLDAIGRGHIPPQSQEARALLRMALAVATPTIADAALPALQAMNLPLTPHGRDQLIRLAARQSGSPQGPPKPPAQQPDLVARPAPEPAVATADRGSRR